MAADGFLSRWARRKNAASAGTPQTEPRDVARVQAELEAEQARSARAAAQDAAAAREVEHAANREAAEAIDLEDINEATDFTAFLKEGVPAALKQAALRKLWRSNPVYACLDGLNDYDTDFTGAGQTLDKVATRWQIGKGYVDIEDTNGEGPAGDEVPAKADDLANAEDAGSADDLANGAERVSADNAEDDVAGIGDDRYSAGHEDPEAVDATRPLRRDLVPGERDAVTGQHGFGQGEMDASSDQGARPGTHEEAGPVRVSLRRRFALQDWAKE